MTDRPRLKCILDRAGELGMAPIVSFFCFGQDRHLRDERAVKRGVEESTHWLLSKPCRNVLVEIDNECGVKAYDHATLTSLRAQELINLAKSIRRRTLRKWSAKRTAG